jgi:hypothetical protein
MQRLLSVAGRDGQVRGQGVDDLRYTHTPKR